ncbi:toxin [Xenophilus sp. Marseille-Q4582]|uniref:toxin n=1 Tax=Xenophilus sp. Marseille-Q4582 TaxID=2866600 RepID=UPI001CE4B0CD|nr:toxin [Xenophilus sp. Marseille-Q4582]
MRFVVVGTSGAGKTHFARALAQAIGGAHIELDALHWGPNWQPVPPAQFAAAVHAAAAGERWVADGNYSAVREALWPRATHIVWLNFSRATVFRRVLGRTLARTLLRTPLWHGNRESLRSAFFSRDSILRWSWTTFERNRARYAALRADPAWSGHVWVELRSPAEAAAILARHARSTP